MLADGLWVFPSSCNFRCCRCQFQVGQINCWKFRHRNQLSFSRYVHVLSCLVLAVGIGEGRGSYRIFSHRELRPLVGPVLSELPHSDVCMAEVSSVCPVYFSLPATLFTFTVKKVSKNKSIKIKSK